MGLKHYPVMVFSQNSIKCLKVIECRIIPKIHTFVAKREIKNGT